ncbi:MAG: hypothetical protein ACOYL6_17220 [Bacteriovoracaceae bacterium]
MTIQLIINKLLNIANEHLIPFMCGIFLVGLVAKFCLWFLKQSQKELAKQVEKKIYMFLIEKEKVNESIEKSKFEFHTLISTLMSIAHSELYDMKIQRMRRKLDYVTSLTDRLFLLSEASQRLNKDVTMQAKYYDQSQAEPDFDEITSYATRSNPSYNRLFGLFSNRSLNSVLVLLPGLFVIGGIFGTFVGIMQGLPELTNMDLSDPAMTKKTMDAFLNNIAYSMNTSLVGIVLCVCMNIFNSLFDTDDLEDDFSDKIKSCMAITYREVLSHRKKNRNAKTTDSAIHDEKNEIDSTNDTEDSNPLKLVG